MGMIGRVISSISFSLFTILLVKHLNPYNFIFDYLGKKSLNFYLIQLFTIQIGLNFFRNSYSYSFFVFACTLLLSIIYDYAEKK